MTVTRERLKDLRREAAEVVDRQSARELYDQLREVVLGLEKRFDFGRRRRRR